MAGGEEVTGIFNGGEVNTRQPEPGYQDLQYLARLSCYTRLDAASLSDYLLSENTPDLHASLIVLCNYVHDLQQRIRKLEKASEEGK